MKHRLLVQNVGRAGCVITRKRRGLRVGGSECKFQVSSLRSWGFKCRALGSGLGDWGKSGGSGGLRARGLHASRVQGLQFIFMCQCLGFEYMVKCSGLTGVPGS